MDTLQMAPISMCFAHCAHTWSYWLWIIIPLLVGGVSVFILHKEGVKHNIDVDNIIKWVCIAVFFIVVCAVLMRPLDLHGNTTLEWALKGEWIGY